MTTVVNLRYSEYDTYIGRAGNGKSGYFGNDHPIGYCNICKIEHDRKGAIAAYKVDFDKRIKEDPAFNRRVLELKGQRLGCFCKQPNREVECHGDILKNFLDS